MDIDDEYHVVANAQEPALSVKDIAIQIFVQKYSFNLLSGAIEWLQDLAEQYDISDVQDAMDTFEHIASACRGAADGPTLISVELLKMVYEKLIVAKGGDSGEAKEFDSNYVLKVVDAFDMPPWRWAEESKTFERATKGTSLAPPATSKARYLRDRFNIIKQVILRDEHFAPLAVIGDGRENYMKLTAIKNLLGRQGGHFLIFGLLARMEDGAFYLEDLEDKVELDLSDATPESGLFTEGSFVLVDGEYTIDSTFKVFEIGHPPSEKRSSAMAIFGHHDFLGLGGMTAEEEAELVRAERAPEHETSFIVLSDLHLDNPKTMTALKSVFSVYEDMETPKPSLFILCGNFRSRPFLFDGDSMREYTQLFDSLAKLLSSFPLLLQHARFLLVPGPTDPWSSLLLPRPALPPSLVQGLVKVVPNITFGSNPCRVRYFSQEIVVFREDMMGRMMRNAVRLNEREESTDLRRALVQTIMDQAHLAPLPQNIRPILWDYDHALRLYPAPTTLILADKFDPYKLVYEECLVFNPGAFARSRFSWSTYYPQLPEPKDRMEESELPGPDDI